MRFDSDAFISYAHLDDQELIEGHKGWVSNFHRALNIRVGQLLGSPPEIWRDPTLKGSDDFEEVLIDRVRRVAVLIAILTPRYTKSEWTLRELREFCERTEGESSGRTRVLKILKTPVAIEKHPRELQRVLGYEFFKVEKESGKIREFDQVFGPEAERDFWMKLDDVAHDLCNLLQELRNEDEAGPTAERASPEGSVIFLAKTTLDLREQHDALRRDLQEHGHTVLPVGPLPDDPTELNAFLLEQLQQASLSIQLLGKNFSVVPEGLTQSLAEIQNELSIQCAERGGLTRLLWIPDGLEIEDERQRRFVESVRTDSRLVRDADLLETAFEDLRTLVHERLRRPEPEPAPAEERAVVDADDLTRVYLVYDQRDVDSVGPWRDALFDAGVEVIPSVFDGDEAEVREYHEECLTECDAVVIFYGAANELWLRRKLREIKKSAGYGRSEPMQAVGIVVGPPANPSKTAFRTHEAIVLPQLDGFSPDGLVPFLDHLKRPNGDPTG